MFATEGLDGCGGVHVGEWNQIAGEAGALKRIPAVFDLADLGHVGHGTACVQVGQDHLLPGLGEHVGCLGHEVNAAKKHVLCVGLGGDLRQLVAVAGVVGKPDDFVALVMMTQQDDVGSQRGARRCDAGIHGVVRL